MRRWLSVCLPLAVLAGCTTVPKADEKTYERIMLPLMTDVQRAEYYKRPTWEERKAYLYEAGLMGRLDAAPPAIRRAILDGRVVKGMSMEQVLMSWGRPVARMPVPPSDDPEVARAEGRKERWLYARVFTTHLNVRYRRAVEFTNGVALFIRDDVKR